MTTVTNIELRHHDIISEGDINKLIASAPSFKIKTRLLEDFEIYDEGVLPPMITIFCKVEELQNNGLLSPNFVKELTQLIDKVRKQKVPGFYSDAGSKFTEVTSFAIFALLENGIKLKFYVKEKEGAICQKAISCISSFLNQYNFKEMKATTRLGLIAFYDIDSNTWQPLGF